VVGIDMLVVFMVALEAIGRTKLVVPQVTTAGQPLKHLLKLTQFLGGLKWHFFFPSCPPL
jgi:hypothetical protein